MRKIYAEKNDPSVVFTSALCQFNGQAPTFQNNVPPIMEKLSAEAVLLNERLDIKHQSFFHKTRPYVVYSHHSLRACTLVI
jgi:hypothetical protein